MAVVTMKQLLDSGAHFGHQTRRWLSLIHISEPTRPY